MAETACLVQTTFSHASDTPFEAKEGNPIHALGESISFGRFMSESLAWEKWSSFNHNKYLEEVEKYSKPGSVAQKKAYFEAHYKKIAQKKAEALLEQANAMANNDSELETNHGFSGSGLEDSQSFGLDSHAGTDEPGEAEASIIEASFSTDGYNSNEKSGGMDVEEMEEVVVLQGPVKVDHSVQIESPNLHEDVENNMAVEVDSTSKQLEKLPLKEGHAANQASSTSTTKTKPKASSSNASVQNRALKRPSTPARPQTPGLSRKDTPNNKKIAKDSADIKRTPKSIHMSLNFAPSPSRAGDNNRIATPILQKTKDSKVAPKTPKDCSTSLRTPAKASPNRMPKLPPVTLHSQSKRPPPSTLQSETKKLSPVTLQAESKRTTTPLEPTTRGSRKMDIKTQSLCIDRSKSSRASSCKVWPLNESSSFSFRTEERAAKRKEHLQKLEEKSSAKEAQKMELQAKSKEKAEAELRKLRQTLGFKAKPMPDFNRETQSSNNQIKKIPLTRPRSPKLGRRPSTNAGQATSSLPPKSPSVKSDASKHGMDKSSRTSTRSVTSLPRKNTHENASPNLQS